MNITIPLKLLDISPLNVRKSPPTDAEQAELAASIFVHGLLENLVVRPTDNDRYEVLAGGRRLMAMQSLAREGELDLDHPVACLVHDGDPQEISLAENIVRLSMHALDQFEAFVALADQGLSIAEIASRFGNTETLVRQRLRLGRVAPEIREAYRADDINLETLMAFAVTEDQGQQLAVWEEIKGGYVHAHHVRRLLTDEKIAASSKFVRFVGLEAYEAAGGTSTRDLFSEGEGATYLDDSALVMRLTQEKLAAAAQDLQAKEGWKWTQALTRRRKTRSPSLKQNTKPLKTA
jgi:ParB family chromosome partitioning protein